MTTQPPPAEIADGRTTTIDRAAIDAAAARPLGSGSTVWLASYPKSGNTWLRAIVTALDTHPHLFGVNHLGSGAQPYGVASALGRYGIDPRWLSRSELDRLRTALLLASETPDIGRVAARAAEREPLPDDQLPPPRLRKTHETYRHGRDGAEPFPLEVTRAALLVVRDPRDVACSYAPFFGVDLDGAIDAMARHQGDGIASPAMARTAQPWGTWSGHLQSWLAPDVPFPVHLVRYEDLRTDTAGTLEPVFAAIGLRCTRAELDAAVEQARFERLRESETERGFRETSPKTTTFFRSGRAGGWRDELSADQVATIEADHAATMRVVGYDLTTTPPNLRPLAAHLGIRVRPGTVPTELDGATRPLPYIQVTDTAIRVQLGPQCAFLVEEGRRVTIDWPGIGLRHGADQTADQGTGPDDADIGDDDPSWILQGWAITMATLQRGELSLHASTVRIGDEVVAIAGNRGAGKSTTSLALTGRGHQLLVDDTTLLRFDDGKAFITPYARNVHLLPDTAEALGIDFEGLPRLAGGRVKAAFTPDEPPIEPQRIDRVVVLVPGRPEVIGDTPVLTEVRGAERLMLLRAHVARQGLAPLVLGEQRFFEQLTRLADAVTVQRLVRPARFWTLDTVLDLIDNGSTRSDDLTGAPTRGRP